MLLLSILTLLEGWQSTRIMYSWDLIVSADSLFCLRHEKICFNVSEYFLSDRHIFGWIVVAVSSINTSYNHTCNSYKQSWLLTTWHCITTSCCAPHWFVSNFTWLATKHQHQHFVILCLRFVVPVLGNKVASQLSIKVAATTSENASNKSMFPAVTCLCLIISNLL